MALPEALAALRRDWRRVIAALPPEGRMAMRQLTRRIAESGWDIIRAGELVRLVIVRLPVDDPVRVAAAEDTVDLAAVAEVSESLDEVRALLEEFGRQIQAEREHAVRAAQDRVLAHPMIAAADLTARGGDPGADDLIRLTDRQGGTVLPAFQFDADGRPHTVVLEINRRLLADTDPWGVASWWLTVNTWVDGVPAQLLSSVPDRDLIELAEAVYAE